MVSVPGANLTMTEFARQFAARRKPPKADPDKPTPARVTRQRRDRLNRDAEYLFVHDIYLEENPTCVLCGKQAKQIHHVVRGDAGRARSLLNSDTWLGVCDSVCHDIVEKLPPENQIRLKQQSVAVTIRRLRK